MGQRCCEVLGIDGINNSDANYVGGGAGIERRVMCIEAVAYSCDDEQAILFDECVNSSGPPVLKLTAHAGGNYVGVRGQLGEYVFDEKVPEFVHICLCLGDYACVPEGPKVFVECIRVVAEQYGADCCAVGRGGGWQGWVVVKGAALFFDGVVEYGRSVIILGQAVDIGDASGDICNPYTGSG